MLRYAIVFTSLLLFSSCAELQQMLEAAAQTPQSQPNSTPQSQPQPQTVKTFEQMDTNADGRLSSVEAQGSVKDGFAKLDANKDGFLTKAEVEGTSPKRTDKRPTKG